MAEIAFNLETVKHPPFENDPPVKFNIPAKTIGLIYGILAAIGLVFLGLFGIIGLLIGGALTAVSVASGNATGPLYFIVSLVHLVISIVAYAMIAWGGYKMYQLDHSGRDMVCLGFFVLVVSNLVGILTSLSPVGLIAGLIGWIISTAITFIFYYLIVISRFPDEAPLVAGGGSAGAPPPSA